MSSRSFLSRLITLFSGMIVLVVGVYGVTIYLAGQRAARAQQIEELSRLATLFREQWTDAVAQPNAAQSAQITSLAKALATRITLINANGHVILDTDVDITSMENHNDRPEIITARAGGSGSSVRFSHTLNEDAVYVARPLDPTKPADTILRLSYPQRVWTKLPVRPWVIVLSGALCVALLMAWLMLLLQRHWVSPVRALSEAAGEMSAGHWGTRVQPRGADELRDFSRRLNHAAEQAETQLADLDARRSELQALVDSLPDPIFLTDRNQRVALINRPAAKLINLSPSRAIGQELIDILGDETLIALFKEADASDRTHGATDEDQLDASPRDICLTSNGERDYFQVVATHTRGGGVLLVLRNVTTMASAVQMKTDFVANASHELRTPIAAIKIAFETLAEVHKEDPAQTDRCIAIISGHLNRLEELLADLLDLSRVESSDLKPQLTGVRVGEVFGSVQGTMLVMARQKGIELVCERNPSAIEIFHSDPRLLNLVLRNLIENSIKFTPSGGRVTLQFGAESRSNGDGTQITMRVIDTGIGIPTEHRERVFERFYQVDTARASAAGRGTGLGLAIVKHAMLALGGSVELDSAVGRGTTVTCRFPQCVGAPLMQQQLA